MELKTTQGKSCRKCGQTERYISTGSCVSCKQRYSRKYREDNQTDEFRHKASIQSLRSYHKRRHTDLIFALTRLLNGAKSRANKRGLEFSISVEDIETPTVCPVLGIELSYFGNKVQAENSATLDRIDSSKGYIKGNVIIVSWRANRLKSDATLQELEKLYMFYKRLKNGVKAS